MLNGSFQQLGNDDLQAGRSGIIHFFQFKNARSFLVASWGVVGAVLFILTLLLGTQSYRFGYDVAVKDMPVLWLMAGLVVAGGLFLTLPFLIRNALREAVTLQLGLLIFMLVSGLAMRAVLFTSEPVLEDDYQRYLWDGAVTANGFNPYKVSPSVTMQNRSGQSGPGQLARSAGKTLERINHGELRTIYPPVAQGAFAAAYWIKPFSLTAWRSIIVVLEMVTLLLLFALLRALALSPLWTALYWWNPLVLKELSNSVHMEALLVPMLLAVLYFAILRRHFASTIALALAVGTKVWPVLLLPIVLRPLWRSKAKLFMLLCLFGLAMALLAWPILMAGFDSSSGFVAYAQKWKTNSALFPAIEQSFSALFSILNIDEVKPGAVARLLIAFLLGFLSLWLSVKPWEEAGDLASRFMIICAAMLLLSPAQFPWYSLWILPFMVLRPIIGLLALTMLLPLYYLGFYFMSYGDLQTFRNVIVWVIWIPVWSLLLWQYFYHKRQPDEQEPGRSINTLHAEGKDVS